MVKENKMMETKEHEYYINCSAEAMHELLDLILANNFKTCDLKIYQLAQFLCVDVEFMDLEQIRKDEEKKENEIKQIENDERQKLEIICRDSKICYL